MTGAAPLLRLVRIARMQRDIDLAALGRARTEMNETLSALEGMSQSGVPADDPVMFQASLAHARWLTQQRGALNIRLASRKATWLAQREAAAHSFGRALALEKLLTRRVRKPFAG